MLVDIDVRTLACGNCAASCRSSNELSACNGHLVVPSSSLPDDDRAHTMRRTRESKPFAHPEFWRPGSGQYDGLWQCVACHDNKWRQRQNALRHEDTRNHKTEVRAARRELTSQLPDNRADEAVSGSHMGPAHVVGPLLSVLRDFRESDDQRRDSDPEPVGAEGVSHTDYNADDEIDPPSPVTFDFASLEGVQLASEPSQAALEHMSQTLTQWLLEGPSVEMDTYSDNEGADDKTSSSEAAPSKEASAEESVDQEEARHWYPWPNKIICVLDILQHLPRSTFSTKQYEIIRWALQVLGISDVPSSWTMKRNDAMLQELCGIKTLRYTGALGHTYYVNDLAAIISQELANPEVRPHLRFRPQDAGQRLCEAYQALRWLTEMDPNLTTPMVRMRNQDFYIFEPALLMNQEICLPVRWFDRGDDIFAEVWPMRVVESPGDRTGWVAYGTEKTIVPASSFVTSFPLLRDSFQARGWHDPRNIVGFMAPRNQGESGPPLLEPWTWTDPSQGNRWRALAKGRKVYAFPIWLYCDDTSGNLSKRWNKHNSFLFTAAGLPSHLVSREYNVHFLATSNLAPPLEMLDGIVQQLENSQADGIWAWDCLEQEMVLIIPSVLALLGDNPMQSELSCHVGLTGKFFCRACFVKGKNKTEESHNAGPAASSRRRHEETELHVSGGGSGDHTSGATSAASQASSTHDDSRRGRKKKPVRETLNELVDRARRFMTRGKPREPAKTMETLRSIFTQASTVGGQTRSRALKTETGVKDMYQDHFSSLVFDFVARLRGSNASKQAELNRYLETLPKDPMSPVWRIKGLNPHQDTPVEILHVILLGFVKYFWRDAISRIKPPQKDLLAVRLSSLNVAGLNISKLSGKTLVQYAGSLTGRDFRVIAQVAPFVLYDLVPKECFDAWLALSALVPLVWQPKIDDIEAHLDTLEFLINHFLHSTARWTPRWFNKPKFHVILHLPSHIRRFGPAGLFATETFESFNAIIRGHSVHSNRQAPSRDIGRSFARANRTRHLLSRGAFRRYAEGPPPVHRRATRAPSGSSSTQLHHPSELTAFDFGVIGEGPQRLLQEHPKLREFLGFPPLDDPSHRGNLVKDSHPAIPWSQTKSAKCIPTALARNARLHTFTYRTCDSASLQNGDKCEPGSWILARRPENELSTPFIGKVAEILQIPSSSSVTRNEPDLVLVHMASTTDIDEVYGMPRLKLTGSSSLFNYSEILCTVNIQHNCAAHACPIRRERRVQQEREETNELADMVVHVNAEDLVLNTAQMRDSRFVSQFKHRPAVIDREHAIHAGAVAEIASQRRADARSQQLSDMQSGPVPGPIRHAAPPGPSRLSAVSTTISGSPMRPPH